MGRITWELKALPGTEAVKARTLCRGPHLPSGARETEIYAHTALRHHQQGTCSFLTNWNCPELTLSRTAAAGKEETISFPFTTPKPWLCLRVRTCPQLLLHMSTSPGKAGVANPFHPGLSNLSAWSPVTQDADSNRLAASPGSGGNVRLKR